MQALTDPQQMHEVLAAPRAVIYKHSPRCWQCALAWWQISKLAQRHPETPVFVIDVLRDAALSTRIAHHLGVPHQSPQVIVVRAGSVEWSASHLGIRRRPLDDAIDLLGS